MIEKILLNKTSIAIPLYPVAVCALPSMLYFLHLFWTIALEYNIDKAFVSLNVSLNEKCALSFNILYLILINLQIGIKYTPITKHRKVCLFTYYDNSNKVVLHIVEFSFVNPFIFKEQCLIPKLINSFHMGPTLPFRPILRTCCYTEVFPLENLQV